LKLLEPPYAIFDIEPCQRVRMTPLRYEIGRMVIRPRWVGAPPEKEVTGIRIWVPEEEKREQLRILKWIPGGGGQTSSPEEVIVLPYWDITSARLRVAIQQIIDRVILQKQSFEIHKVGMPPKAFFSLRIIAL